MCRRSDVSRFCLWFFTAITSYQVSKDIKVHGNTDVGRCAFQPTSSMKTTKRELKKNVLHHTRIRYISNDLASCSCRIASNSNNVVSTIPLSMLKDKTVKELKDLAKCLPGYSSKIRLKQDLIQFVASQQMKGKDEVANMEDKAPTSIRKRQRRQPTFMPADSGDDDFQTVALNGDPNMALKKKGKKGKNKKDALFDFVTQRYPPLEKLLEQETLTTRDENSPDTALKFEGVDWDDIRAQHHPMLKHAKKLSSDMELVFVGTASCCPSATRGVSCTALRLNWRRKKHTKNQNHYSMQQQEGAMTGSSREEEFHDAPNDPPYNGDEAKDATRVKNVNNEAGTWLFDCGECTQLQLQKTSYVKPGKITKIFITHAHGDHTFGLPGVLCLMGQDRPRNGPPIEIYGPEGLRMYLRVALRYSISRIVPNYVVHELKDIPMAPEWRQTSGWYNKKTGRYVLDTQQFFEQSPDDGQFYRWEPNGLAGEDPTSWISLSQNVELQPHSGYGEIGNGRDIYPQYDHPLCVDGAPIWLVEDEGDVSVVAAPMSHGVPCVGYVVTEENKPGRLKPELVKPIIDRNYEELKTVIKNPMKVMEVIKNLPDGSSYTFPDGTVLQRDDVVEETRKGRKIALLGDTLDARAIAGLAHDADVVVHEATNTFLDGIDVNNSVRDVTVDAMRHGHSTPYMAGDFAKKINAKNLVLNHFSSRYKGDQTLDSISIMTRIERQAIRTSKLADHQVAAAWDFMILPIRGKDDKDLESKNEQHQMSRED